MHLRLHLRLMHGDHDTQREAEGAMKLAVAADDDVSRTACSLWPVLTDKGPVNG